jgi:hypothetical protein
MVTELLGKAERETVWERAGLALAGAAGSSPAGAETGLPRRREQGVTAMPVR